MLYINCCSIYGYHTNGEEILLVWFPPIELLDGGKNPTFQEKFVLPLIEGLRELNVAVWNSHTLTSDEFIGSGR